MWKKLNFVANRDRKKGFDNEFKINKRAIKGSPLPPNCYEDINDTDIDKIGKF